MRVYHGTSLLAWLIAERQGVLRPGTGYGRTTTTGGAVWLTTDVEEAADYACKCKDARRRELKLQGVWRRPAVADHQGVVLSIDVEPSALRRIQVKSARPVLRSVALEVMS